MAGLAAQITAIRADLAMLKSAFGGALKVGPVEEIDLKKGYRIKLLDGPDGPYLSPWLPHPESSKTSIPLRKNDVVGVFSPSGDLRQGLVFRGGYSGVNPNPSTDIEEDVLLSSNGVRLVAVNGDLVLEQGNLRVAAGNTDLNGGHVKNDGVAIDKTHKHQDVLAGTDLSGVPEGG